MFRGGGTQDVFLVHTRGGEAGVYSLDSWLDGVLVPLNYLHLLALSLSHTHIQTLPACVCWSVLEEVVCRWLLIGPQGPEGWVMGDTGEVVYVCFRHIESLDRMAKVFKKGL